MQTHIFPSRQRGMSLILISYIVLTAGFLLIMAIKIVPSYMEYFNVRGAMNSLQEAERAELTTPGTVHAALMRRLSINSVYSVERGDISVERAGQNAWRVTVDYEVRKPLISNIDVVLRFDRSVEVAVR